MPTIQQLVRKGQLFWKTKVNLRHWIHVLKDVACV